MEWMYLLGFGLFPLTARAFAPLADRLASVAGRLEGIPRLLDEAAVDAGQPPEPAGLAAPCGDRRPAAGRDPELGREALERAEAATPRATPRARPWCPGSVRRWTPR